MEEEHNISGSKHLFNTSQDSYNSYVKGCDIITTIGEPSATEMYSIAQLSKMGLIGVYAEIDKDGNYIKKDSTCCQNGKK